MIQYVQCFTYKMGPHMWFNSILHTVYFRDPRAVILSRKNFGRTAKGIDAKGDLNQESTMFCQNLVKDILTRKRLESQYPGTFMEVLYDRFVTDPFKYSRAIYQFINATWTGSVNSWIVNTMETSRNSKFIAAKWLSTMSVANAMTISRNCRKVFELVEYDWVARYI